MNILTIGSAVEDIFLQPTTPRYQTLTIDGKEQEYLLVEKGRKADLQQVTLATGGASTNCAVTFKNFGFDVAVWSIIGDDYSGEFIVNTLTRFGIPTDYLVQNELLPTTRSFIFTFPDGDRSILTNRGAQKELSIDLPDEVLSAQNCLYISGLTPKPHAQLYSLLERAKQRDIFVALNPGSYQLSTGIQELLTCLPLTDLLILNRSETELLFKHASNTLNMTNAGAFPNFIHVQDTSCSAHDVFTVFKNLGLKNVVITHGKHGVYAADSKQVYYHPALVGPIINTVGAGDAFGSACCAALLEKHPLSEAILFGLCNARGVISKLDAKSGILDKHELDAQTKAIGMQSLQTFAW